MNNLELPISTRNAEVLKMYAAQVKPLLTSVNSLLERCQTAYDNTIRRNVKVSSINKEKKTFLSKGVEKDKESKIYC